MHPILASPMRILIACVGNVLRRDDGFGHAVAARLVGLPSEVTVVETGIGGIDLLQELMLGYDGLLVVDAVDRGGEPGTIFVIRPEVDAAEAHVPDVHLANPQRVLSMAKALDCLPPRVGIVGCQPGDVDGLGEPLTPAVERAVDVAVASLREVVDEWITGPTDSSKLGQQVDVSTRFGDFRGPAAPL